jgi:phospholipid/cholesterol/gamma-HCH transport system permease protein
MNKPADFEDVTDGGVRTLRFSGSLTLPRLKLVPERLIQIGDAAGLRVDLSGIDRMDTVGAWLIHRLTRDGAELVGADDDMQRLLAQVGEADKPVKIRPDPRPGWERIIGDIGRGTVEAGRVMVGFMAFFGEIMVGAWNVIRRPRRFRFNAVVRQFEVVGVDALPIVGLMSFLIGIVIAQQGAVQLRQFGAEVFAINLIGRITTRELGVLMTAIMVAGRSGSAFAAQLGSMKLAEEIDAMRTIGVAPVEALILPRVIACTILMPLLGFYASIVAIFGGGLYCWIALGIPPATFITRLREVVPITDLWVGLVKGPVFGAIVAVTGCFHGMQVKGNAEEVGLRTTAAVVQAIFLVIVLDAVFAVFFSAIGWI